MKSILEQVAKREFGESCMNQPWFVYSGCDVNIEPSSLTSTMNAFEKDMLQLRLMINYTNERILESFHSIHLFFKGFAIITYNKSTIINQVASVFPVGEILMI